VFKPWNSLPEEVVIVKEFEARLDNTWKDQPMKFDYKEELRLYRPNKMIDLMKQDNSSASRIHRWWWWWISNLNKSHYITFIRLYSIFSNFPHTWPGVFFSDSRKRQFQKETTALLTVIEFRRDTVTAVRCCATETRRHIWASTTTCNFTCHSTFPVVCPPWPW